MRHTNGELVWAGTNSNQYTYALNDNGARYTIDRWAGEWIISYLPFGTADKGRQPVPWLPGRRSLTTAKEAAAAHYEHNQLA
ncbi:hypothetical protein [Mycolicibacterium goodii]|uniref:hypothetical protein n=1 Tax=Mycolicibacterium goodii TaxID=134601 RepID=UPI001BDD7C12|nr:hypothetical protein [Mycolicibacterium goodii]MBU8839052.1 hypothetical protein [Mycolicibacterium goodii]